MAKSIGLTFLQIGVLALVISLFTGCYLRPNWGPPGTIYDQRARAVLSDPFPNNEIGPEVVGGRPRGYDLPLAQPTNIQASPYSELNKNNRPFWNRLATPRYAPQPNFVPQQIVPGQVQPNPVIVQPQVIPGSPQPPVVQAPTGSPYFQN